MANDKKKPAQVPHKPLSSIDFNQQDNDIAKTLLDRAPQDLVFKMSFVGQRQHLLFNHFRQLNSEEMNKQGLDGEEGSLLGLFAESHAAELREFVFTGVALQHLFHLKELEGLSGEASSLILVDIWDTLKSYIKTAEDQFKSQAKELPTMLTTLEKLKDQQKIKNEQEPETK